MLLCDSMCCLRCVVGCRRCVGCCVVMTVQKKTKMKSGISENPAREFFPITVLCSVEKIKTALNYRHYSFILIRKNLHDVKSVILFAEMVQLTFGNIALVGDVLWQPTFVCLCFNGTDRFTTRLRSFLCLRYPSLNLQRSYVSFTAHCLLPSRRLLGQTKNPDLEHVDTVFHDELGDSSRRAVRDSAQILAESYSLASTCELRHRHQRPIHCSCLPWRAETRGDARTGAVRDRAVLKSRPPSWRGQ